MNKFYKKYKRKIRKLKGQDRDQYATLVMEVVALEDELAKEKRLIKDTGTTSTARLVVIEQNIKVRLNRLRLILDDDK